MARVAGEGSLYVNGPLILPREVSLWMPAGGSVVNVASIDAFIGSFRSIAYSAEKSVSAGTKAGEAALAFALNAVRMAVALPRSCPVRLETN